ncbi:N-6 DNA methylase [Streptomyces albogriseolus]|uniref:N-6 DNA methylase n=1 Tax=Streptomyces albogriseolus TaxID=1887 RepID=UPI003460AF32
MEQPSLFDDLDPEPQKAPIPATFRTPAATAHATPRTPAPHAPARTTPRQHTPRPLTNAKADGQALGEAVAYAWHSGFGGTDIGIPLGTVAALALFPLHRDKPRHLGEWLLTLTPAELQATYREVMAWQWIRRPDLIETALPILRWTEQDLNKNQLDAMAAVTRAALKHNVLELTGADPYIRADVDLMSWTLTQLRSRGAAQGLGEYHTPPEVCDVMARMIYGTSEFEPGQAFNDPACGTGGLFRSLVQIVREAGHDPHDHIWVMQDIDAIAAAGAAVNAILWDLGPNVLIAVGDTLAHGDLAEKANEHRRGVLAHRNEIVRQAVVLAAVRNVENLITMAAGA